MEPLAGSGLPDLLLEARCRGRRIVICEDHPHTRLGLRETCVRLGCVVVGETALGEEAIELVDSLRPDLLILDLHLPGKVDGQGVQQELRRRGLPTKVLVSTTYGDTASFFDWITQPDGPEGVLPKDTSLYEFRLALAQLLSTDEKYISESVWHREQGRPNPLSKLAPHEIRVLRDVAQGYRLAEVARRQQLAVSSVRSYMNDIYCKLQLPSNTLQAAAITYNQWIQAYEADRERRAPDPA